MKDDIAATQLPSTGLELLTLLDGLCAGFRTYWYGAGNVFQSQDTPPTVHAVFAAFSQYVRGVPDLLTGCAAPLLGFVERCVSEPDSVPLSNAAATCFVENLAGDGILERFAPMIGPNTLAHLRYWSR
jgi:hypothetical protein